MNIAVIGANGQSGSAFVDAALIAGHSINAGTHGKQALKSHPRLKIMACDATNIDDLHSLLEGQDAVVSLIGHVKGSPANVQTDSIEKVIAVMNELKIDRLVSLTGTGVRFPGDKITFIDRILNCSISLIDPQRIRDGINHVEVLKKSNVSWTLIRVLKLQNTAPKPFSLSPNGPTKIYVSRQDVAEAIIEVLRDSSFVRQAPIISKLV